MAHRYASCFAIRSNGPLNRLVQCGCQQSALNRFDGRLVKSQAYRCYSVAGQANILSSRYIGQKSKWRSSSVQYKTHYLGSPSPRTDLRLYQDTLFLRPFHSTHALWKEDSKVEKTVRLLKEAKQNILETKKGEPAVPETVKEKKTIVMYIKNGWHGFVHFLKQTWNGFKLLCIDVKVCSGLVLKLLNGKTLTRREYRQLVRTTADLFRLVPFSVFIIVPFMEFLLPVAMKLFPNMLPSTFKSADVEKEKLKKQLKAKMEMAKFLQDTVKESAPLGAKKGVRSSVEEFSEFMNKIRSSGAQASTDEILKFSKLFENELTLDNMSHAQIQALCVVLGISRIGPEILLRMRLNVKMRELLDDDQMIQKEGVESLAVWELQDACRARGMRGLGMPAERLKSQLQQWIDLHVKEKIPTSLLLLSRAMYLPETLSTTEQLQATISALPTNTEVKAKIKIAETSGEQVDNKTMIEHIKQMDEEIKKEEALQRSEDEAKAAKEAALAMEAQAKEAEAMETAKAMEDAMATDATKVEDIAKLMEAPVVVEPAVDIAEPIAAKPSEEFPAEKSISEDITVEDLMNIETALEEIAEERRINIAADELKDLRADMEEYEEDVQDLKDAVVAYEGDISLEESKGANRLVKRVNRLLKQSDKLINELHKEKAVIQEEIEVKEVRMKRNIELTEDETKRVEMEQLISEEKVNLISINELMLGLKRLQKIPDDTRLQGILEVLDQDNDGNIDVNQVLKVIEVLSRENLKLSAPQVTEVIDLLKKEEIMLVETKNKEKDLKESEQNFQKQEETSSAEKNVEEPVKEERKL